MNDCKPFDNSARALSVDAFALKFASDMGLEPHPDFDGPETVVGDFISNLLHWAMYNGLSKEEALKAAKSGIGNFITETHIDYGANEVDELGPDTFVSIVTECMGERITI